MHISSARLGFYLADVHSLKEKRRYLSKLIDKTKSRFNVAIAEVDNQDDYRTLTIGISVVSSSHFHAHEMCQKIIDYIEKTIDLDLISITFSQDRIE